MLMTKGLMERSLHHEMALGRVREKAKLAKEELFELRNWKVVTKQKLKLAERARDEFQKMTEELKKVLEDKENDLRHAKETAFWNIVTLMPFYQSSESHITTILMMLSVKPRPCIQSLIFHLSISAFRRQRPFIPSSQMIRTSFLERRCPSPSPLSSQRLKEKKPVKPKTPSLLMLEIFYPFLFYTSILRTIMFCPLCTGLSCIRCVCRHFISFV